MKKFIAATLVLVTVGALFYLYNKKDNVDEGDMDLIPRKVLFSNPKRLSVKISPDSQHISYIAPSNGVLNIFIAPKDDIENASPLTKNTTRGIRQYFWSYDNKHVIYIQDSDGDENWRIHKVNIDTFEDTLLTPQASVQARINNVSHLKPDSILVELNTRKPEFHDLYELNLGTGELELIFENNEYGSITTDDHYRVRFLSKQTADGGEMLYKLDNGEITDFMEINSKDIYTTGILGFGPKDDMIYILDSRGRNTGALYSLNLTNEESTLIHSNDKTDIDRIMTHPTDNIIEAVVVNYQKPKWHIVDNSIQQDFDFLSAQHQGEVNIVSRALDNKTWIVAYLSDNRPAEYFLYNRNSSKLVFICSTKPELLKYELAEMHPILMNARDGLELVSYLTIPVNAVTDKSQYIPDKPLPLILLVHGGPTARDEWGLNIMHQWLANRGYAVLSVNYRGSTGFGKDFIAQGNGEWAGKMHTDLIDAVNWAIDNKITEKGKIAIMGGSYGGYATLVGLTMTPEIFACGVDIVGPSNLVTLMESIPPYWKPYFNALKTMIGADPGTEEGKKFLRSRSPLNFASNIEKPLLIAQGANDPRVKQAESDQIVNALKHNETPVIYALYSNEGHGFVRPENRLSFNAVVEKFLHHYLCGRYEEITDDFKGSSIKIREGEDILFPEH